MNIKLNKKTGYFMRGRRVVAVLRSDRGSKEAQLIGVQPDAVVDAVVNIALPLGYQVRA